ncbi:MAG TPA: TonB-dependent receptor [Gemmatimonadales bacterium]|jgi:iron complex outermembrane receptor protein
MRIQLGWLIIGAGAIGAPLAAQTPDSAAAIPGLEVTVTRNPAPLAGLGAAVTVIDSASVRRGRIGTGLDETLAFVPGVVAENRWNYSVDERVAIRGFGARSNFGLRGVTVLIDGVPQTLPDGQTQLNNLDLAIVSRVEVMRSGASALYGNAGGGVIAFTTTAAPTLPWVVSAGAEGGPFGTSKEELTAGGRTGPLGATLSLSRFSTDGSRQQSAADQRRLNFGLDWAASSNTALTVRVSSADDPHAENPGALTAAELAINPDSASAANIRRGADKAVTQTQVAIGVHHDHSRLHLDATVFGLTRNLDNPLATPPPAPAAANEGTWVGIGRLLGGARASATVDVGRASITGGVDAQSLRDNRTNRRSVGGVATDTLILDQTERVSEAAAFVQGSLALTPRLSLRAGIRRDVNHFSVADHFLSDGDASGDRTMQATSGNGGLAFRASPHLTVWSDISTVFETPTTTELANQPDGAGGFNPDLNPERSVSEEAGIRGAASVVNYEIAAYHTVTHDAIVPFNEVGGRTYYRNAGSTRTNGVEGSITWRVARALAVIGTWTITDARFGEYRIVNPTSIDTLDGNRVAGIPRSVGRIGVQGSIGRGFSIDVDQGFTSSIYGDDDNTIPVAGWGAGVTGARLSWHGPVGGVQVAPFVAALNLFDRRYVGSVTTDGAGGRVFEPAAGRTVYFGMSVTAAARRR